MSNQEQDRPSPAARRAVTSIGWAAGIVVPPLVVFGLIAVLGLGGGWRQLVGADHPQRAQVVGTHEIGACGSRNGYTEVRLDLAWRAAGSTRTGHVDHCDNDGTYRTGDDITVRVGHDDRVVTDRSPWFLRGVALVFTVIIWGALLWQRRADRRGRGRR